MLNYNIGKMYIPNISNQLLGTINNLSVDIYTSPNILPQSLAPGLLRQYICIINYWYTPLQKQPPWYLLI